ncbi:PEP-CTERM sorting domain-containing protein [Leptolyngbya cf. ectocarpi LEGE 11479]|uniref:PEP-CTERM sorting domain-containing protein n=1 Tax=Leptolyngbya cf. ectocarpi LEGE 11479 TaxID=1828722 RepID=A0A928ZTS4_LEPEC|nr:PEP-CTERM sorting domain-containing protein [Leptolyngbya ectocarpi]MBE9066989.1 PEP-CTERM sorting domain-containing protein [Leptolyngbya cf. ectocarpi LEGE 11479]
MNLSKTALSLGIASVMLGTTLVDDASAQRRRRTTQLEADQTSNVSDFALKLLDTGVFTLLCYSDAACAFDETPETGLLLAPSEGSLTDVSFGSNVLEFTLFFDDATLVNPNDSADTAIVDFSFAYEFDFNRSDFDAPDGNSNFNPTFLEIDDIESSSSEQKVQKILDFIAIGDPDSDTFDNFTEGLGGSSSVPGAFGSNGNIFLATADGTSIKDDTDLQDFMARVHDAYAPGEDNDNYAPEPLNEFDEIRAQGEDLVDVPEPGTMAGLLALTAIGSGTLLSRKKQST